jgi:hypothetical protein
MRHQGVVIVCAVAPDGLGYEHLFEERGLFWAYGVTGKSGALDLWHIWER